MQETNLSALKFIGKPFTPAMQDENGAFYGAYQELNENELLVELDDLNKLNANRAYMVEFGPESYMLWQGMLFLGDNLPNLREAGLFSYDLPASSVIEDVRPGNEVLFTLPLNLSVGNLLNDIKKAGFKLPANLGLSEKPYLINLLDLTTQEQKTYVYEGESITDVND